MASQKDSDMISGDMAQRMSSDAFLERAIQAAVRAAVREHKRAGNSVAGWQDGQVVVVAPEDILIPPDEATEVAAT